MAREVERKFLVTGDGWRSAATDCLHMIQAYLALRDELEVRVRITDGEKAKLTIKSGSAKLSRSEYEYDIPLSDARGLLAMAQGHRIEKKRHIVPREGGRHWDVDVFEGVHEGLRLAEVEFDDQTEPDAQIERPEWLGDEVTGQPEYYNASLARDGKP